MFSIVDVQFCIHTYRVPFAPNPNQQLFLVVLKITILTDMRYFIVVLICIPLILMMLSIFFICILPSQIQLFKNILTCNGCITAIVSELINTYIFS